MTSILIFFIWYIITACLCAPYMLEDEEEFSHKAFFVTFGPVICLIALIMCICEEFLKRTFNRRKEMRRLNREIDGSLSKTIRNCNNYFEGH